MKLWIKPFAIGFSLMALLVLSPSALGEYPVQDIEAAANRLVTQCAAIHEGELVMIQGRPQDMPLLEQVAVHVRKLGAFPLMNIQSEDLERRLYMETPAKYDTQTPTMEMKLAGMIDAIIRVTADENPMRFNDIPAERIAARQTAMRPVHETLMNRKVRLVELGNGLYPTDAAARRLGLTMSELTTMFNKGLNVDYWRLQAVADTVRARLTSGQTVKITNENGTNLTVRIDRPAVFVNDGVISTDDMQMGKAACQAWLPAGEVFCAVKPNTAEGVIVVDRHFFNGKEIRDLRLTFKDGKLTKMTARSGIEELQALYDASGKGKDLFGAIDIGVNPEISVPEDSRMTAWMASGMITVGVGSNTWAGGDNNSAFALYTHISRGNLMIDDKPLVKNGVLTP